VLEHALKGELYTGPDEMLEAVNVAYEYIKNLGGAQSYERRLRMPYGDGEQWGTVDTTAHKPGHLHVIDYKHGAGVPVHAIENLQGICYALGVLAERVFVEEKITITIIQPRTGEHPIKSWTIHIDELLSYLPFFNDAIVKAEECIAAVALGLEMPHPLNPGKEQCRWCPAAETGTCPALRDLALTAAQADLSGVVTIDELRPIHLPEPTDLPVDKMAEVLAIAPILNQWFSDVESYAVTLMRKGSEIPGQKLVQPMAKRRWHGKDDLLATRLSEITGGAIPRDTFLRWSLVSITDATALLRRWGKPGGEETRTAITEAMAFLTLRSSTGLLQMVPLSDARPSVSPAVDFKGVDVTSILDGSGDSNA